MFFILIIFTLLSGGFAYRTHIVALDNKQTAVVQIASDKAQLKNIDKERANYSEANIYQKITKDDINIGEQKKAASKNINDSMGLFFNDTKNESDYKNIKKELPKKIGDSFSKPLLAISKPTVSQTGEKKPNFDGLDYSIVSFGNYDYINNELPMTVAVSYNQKINTTPSGIKQEESSKTTHTKVIYNLIYNVKKNQYSYQSQETGGTSN